MAKKKPLNNSKVTQDIIHKIHLTLSDTKTGEEILGFLKSTEPVFMTEVSRFIHSEMRRLEYSLPSPQVNYISSVIGAAYIAGFLIAREADHKIYNGLINFESPVNKALNSDEVDKLIDKYRGQGKNYKQIGQALKKLTSKNSKPERKALNRKSKTPNKRFEIKGLN